MPPRIERVLGDWLASGARGIGQILIRKQGDGFVLCHRDDEATSELQTFHSPDDAVEIARLDDAGEYRPLKTAPNLRHGWRLELADLASLRRALEGFYPGRLAALTAWEGKRLSPTPLRATLNRQTGMYRVTAKVSDEQAEAVIGRVCRSEGGDPGCLRTILWSRDQTGARPSDRLPPEKYAVPHDQTGRGEKVMPLLCQEACNILVAEMRKELKGRE
jgi:sirohydrochlorin cobaltochelatase